MSTQPIPVVDWLATDEQWRAARRRGCSASDVAALLGFDRYTTPWALWAEKTGHPMAPVDQGNEAARLGSALEDWLLTMAGEVTGYNEAAHRLSHRLYQHPEHAWRLCTPDGAFYTVSYPGATSIRVELVETKTAGLVTGRALGWTDTTIPLGYELQTRWQMHVMGAPICHVVALVAGRGLCHYPIARDLDLEAELIRQVDAWWTHHIIDGVEPPLSGRDSTIIATLYPRVERKAVNLDGTDAMTYWQAYREAHAEVTEAEARKAEAGTALRALLGDARTGLVDGRPIATWGERKGRVDWEAISRELYDSLTALLPDPSSEPGAPSFPDLDALAEQHRGATTRSLIVKE